MLTVNIRGAEAMPLRAISFATAGLIDGNSICAFTIDSADHPYWNTIRPFTLDSAHAPVDLPAGSLRRMKHEMEDVRRRGGSLAEIRECTPPGLYAWVREVKLAYEHFIDDFVRESGDALPPWSTCPPINNAELAFAMDPGPDSQVVAAQRLPTPKKTHFGGVRTTTRDLDIHRRARELVEEMVQAGEMPKKGAVSEKIADESPISIERASRVLAAAGIDWPSEKERALAIKHRR